MVPVAVGVMTGAGWAGRYDTDERSHGVKIVVRETEKESERERRSVESDIVQREGATRDGGMTTSSLFSQ